MRILLWHGWLLWGSGSNVYTASLAREWRRKGHDVFVLCQDNSAAELDFVDEHGKFTPDNERVELESTGAAPAPGRCRVLLPSIGRLLPVFVHNEYPGFEAKRFVDLTDTELDTYVERNVTALAAAIRFHDPDVIAVGHEVMGPFIAMNSCSSSGRKYSAQLHGSGLEYAVKVQERYRHFAVEGLSGANSVVGGSRYMISAALEVAPGWAEKAAVVNLGCDVELFRPTPRDPQAPFTVGFVGSLIENKGIHHLLAALPLLSPPKVRAVIVGTGSRHREAEGLWRGIQGGNRKAFREFPASEGNQLETFLSAAGSDYFDAAGKVQVEFTGHLDHEPLSRLLPHFDVLTAPSVLPEAFGLVAAEAAACGVLPVVPDHSGIGEVGAAVEECLGRPGLLTFQPTQPIESLAAAINRVAELPAQVRADMEHDATNLARERWSWGVVGERLLEAFRS